MAYQAGLVPAPPAGGQELFLAWDAAAEQPDWRAANGTDLFMSDDGWMVGDDGGMFLRADGWTKMQLLKMPETQEEFAALTWYDIEKLAKDCAAKAKAGIDGGYSALVGFYKEDTCGGELNGFRLVDVAVPDAWDRYPYSGGYAGFVFETMSCYNNLTTASGLSKGIEARISPYANAVKFQEALTSAYEAMPPDMQEVIKEAGIPCANVTAVYGSDNPFSEDQIETDYYKLWFPSYSNLFGYTEEGSRGYQIAYEGEGFQFAYYRDSGVTTKNENYAVLIKARSYSSTIKKAYPTRTPRITGTGTSNDTSFSIVTQTGGKSFDSSVLATYNFAFCFAV